MIMTHFFMAGWKGDLEEPHCSMSWESAETLTTRGQPPTAPVSLRALEASRRPREK